MVLDNKTNSFIGVIPARGGSKRLPNKNLRIINQSSITELAIQEGLKSRFIKKIILSSDSSEILALGRNYDISIDKRDACLSTDKSTTLSLLENLITKYNIDPENTSFVLLQPTSPLRFTEDIDRAINIYNANNADSVVSAFKVPNFLSYKKMMEVSDENKILNFELNEIKNKKIFVRNGPAVLVTKVENVIAGSLYGFKTYISEMPFNRSIDIDEKEDYIYAKLMYENFLIDNFNKI